MAQQINPDPRVFAFSGKAVERQHKAGAARRANALQLRGCLRERRLPPSETFAVTDGWRSAIGRSRPDGSACRSASLCEADLRMDRRKFLIVPNRNAA
jgi:hypothetical protein